MTRTRKMGAAVAMGELEVAAVARVLIEMAVVAAERWTDWVWTAEMWP